MLVPIIIFILILLGLALLANWLLERFGPWPALIVSAIGSGLFILMAAAIKQAASNP